MNKTYDIVIVGAGPSGTFAGINAIKNGLSCCIIEKNIFPRKKLCGGLVTQKTINLIKEVCDDIDEKLLYNRVTTSVEMLYKNEKKLEFNTDTPLYFTYREDFDNVLYEEFKKMGGVIYNYTVNSNNINVDKNSIALDNLTIQYKYLIGADGANSVVRKFMDKKYNANGLCLEVEVDFDSMPKRDKDLVSIYFGVIPNGYGWVFPKKNGYTVGLGGNLKTKNEIKEYFNKLFNNLEINPIPEPKGAFIPYGKHPSRLVSNNIILVGDSAGFVDPISGEGIYFALLSGKMSIDSILESSQNKDLELYYKKHVKFIKKIITKGTFIQSCLFNKYIEPLFFKYIKNHNNSVKYLVDNLVSNYNFTYGNILKLIAEYKKSK